jgi:transposase InsO family protein
MDFISARLTNGRLFRILTVIDQFTRECVALQADVSMNGKKVAAALNHARRERSSLPESITVDNGLNASKKIRMSAEEVCSTQGMRAVGEMSFKESQLPKWVFHEVRDPAHHNEHKICAGAQS